MTFARAVSSLTIAVVLGTLLAACSAGPASSAGPVGASGTSGPTIEQSATSEPSSEAALPEVASPGAQGSGSSAKAIDQQLDAMQKELDSLEMPGDQDFGDAENALY